MRQIRALRDCGFSDGASNMAVDCAILEAVAGGDQPPTLRLYGWAPFCLSLGYGQRIGDVDHDALAKRGWDLLRRPTGGKAILHGDELTYSLSLPPNHPLAGEDVVESYRRISAGLLRALECLGLSAVARHQGEGARRGQAGPVCFEMPSHYEVSFGGRKLIGSAQLRRKGAVLQHGALPLTGDVARICDALRFDSAEERAKRKAKVRERAVTLAQAAGKTLSWSAAAAAIEAGFARAFGLELAREVLSPAETARADELKCERFGNPAWTNKR